MYQDNYKTLLDAVSLKVQWFFFYLLLQYTVYWNLFVLINIVMTKMRKSFFGGGIFSSIAKT